MSKVPPSVGTASAPACEPHVEEDLGSPASQPAYNCLAAIEMFKDYSFEEMRLADVMGGRGDKV